MDHLDGVSRLVREQIGGAVDVVVSAIEGRDQGVRKDDGFGAVFVQEVAMENETVGELIIRVITSPKSAKRGRKVGSCSPANLVVAEEHGVGVVK